MNIHTNDRERVKGALAALRAQGMNARHAWVGLGFDGVQVDFAGVPSRDWYDSTGALLGGSLPLVCPPALSHYVVAALLRVGMLAVSCPFYDLGVVYVVSPGNDAEADRLHARWLAEVAGDIDALRGLSVEDTYRLGRLAVTA